MQGTVIDGNANPSLEDKTDTPTQPPSRGIQKPLFRGLSHEWMQELQQQETPVQTKLTLGKAGDKYEQEADAVAHQVVNQINSPTPSTANQEDKENEPNPLNTQTLPSKNTPIAAKPNPPSFPTSLNSGESVSQPIEQGIQQARSGGVPLAEGIREPMEQAFGADFSGVRVHTDVQSDGLNQSLSSRAFTTGEDIFFRQGEYNPGSRGGQELLAHELTHVVQQNRQVQTTSRKSVSEAITPPKYIQRAIGFEFETGVPVRKTKQLLSYKTEIFLSPQAQNAKSDNIHTGAGGWKIHADVADDSSVLEFVTLPAHSKEQVTKVMTEILSFIDHMAGYMKDKGKNSHFLKLEDIVSGKEGKLNDKLVIGYSEKEKKEAPTVNSLTNLFGAKVQVTMGIPLSEVADFLFPQNETNAPRLTSFGDNNPYRLYEPTPRFFFNTLPKPRELGNRYLQEVKIPVVYQKSVLGLVALVCDKLNDMLYTYANNDPPQYVKSEFNLLHRTDFHSMYDSLGEGISYFNATRVGELWVRMLWKQNEVFHNLLPPILSEFRLENQPLAPYPYDITQLAENVLTRIQTLRHPINGNNAPTMHEWLNSITDQTKTKDLMSSQLMRDNSSSMGEFGMDTQEPTSLGIPHAIFEIRSIGVQVDYKQWKSIAEELYDVYNKMHRKVELSFLWQKALKEQWVERYRRYAPNPQQ